MHLSGQTCILLAIYSYTKQQPTHSFSKVKNLYQHWSLGVIYKIETRLSLFLCKMLFLQIAVTTDVNLIITALRFNLQMAV